ncbi:MAG TPA: thioredoxin family protein [Puia sp.]|nr:thioredoxin family protein [Puia sp.]
MRIRFHRSAWCSRLLSPPNLLLAVISIFVLSEQHAFAQQGGDSAQRAIRWEFSAMPAAGDTPLIALHARIGDGWKLYSTTNPDSLGNSRVTLDSSVHGHILGILEKGRLQHGKDALFNGTETSFFTDRTDWQIRVRVAPGSGDIKGTLSFMAVKGDSVIGPVDTAFRFGRGPDGGWIAKSTGLQQSASGSEELKKTSIDLRHPVNSCGGTGTEDSGSKSLLGIFILGFFGGLVALFMPCTFPMIPLTVSYFTKKATSRSQGIFNAVMYGFFIFIVYVLISVPFYFLSASDANILNTISTNVWLNVAFSVVFLAFALSFFGLFEITLPGRFSNTVDARSGIGSIGGIFFMALTLVIVSFSCTGPILGTLLVGALGRDGGAVQLTFAMAGFGLALGLPFALFALFPNWLRSLPRSGGWMNTLKIVFGFIELALALKYFSNADLVTHWGLLKRETFLGAWILTGIALVLYLFGVLRFPHDPPPEKLGKGRIGVGLVFLALVLYMLPGLTHTRYSKLALLSGTIPPLNYSLYGEEENGAVKANVMNDYDRALQLAREQHKPVLIDFTGWACSNCRRMEENVWTSPEVKPLIQKDYILVSLYVDDRQLLPENQQFLFTANDGSKKEIRTIGDKYATLQSENFKNASQPYYVLIDPNERLLTLPVAYTPSATEYAQWLRCGLDAFHRQSGTAAR